MKLLHRYVYNLIIKMYNGIKVWSVSDSTLTFTFLLVKVRKRKTEFKSVLKLKASIAKKVVIITE